MSKAYINNYLFYHKQILVLQFNETVKLQNLSKQKQQDLNLVKYFNIIFKTN